MLAEAPFEMRVMSLIMQACLSDCRILPTTPILRTLAGRIRAATRRAGSNTGQKMAVRWTTTQPLVSSTLRRVRVPVPHQCHEHSDMHLTIRMDVVAPLESIDRQRPAF